MYILLPPEPLSVPENISITSDQLPELGMPLNLTCTVGDSSDMTLVLLLRFQWYRDGEPLPKAIKPFIHFKELQYQDRGSYACEVTARNATSQSEAFLLIFSGI